jgi:hypothetical protein
MRNKRTLAEMKQEVKLKCSSSFTSNWVPENVLKDKKECWMSENIKKSWIEIHFLSIEIEISKYRLKTGWESRFRPFGFKLEGSNDGSYWTFLDSRLDVFDSSDYGYFSPQYGGRYSYFRFTQTFPNYKGD